MSARHDDPAMPWLKACRAAVVTIAKWLDANPAIAERGRPLRRGKGGDVSLAVDEAAEDRVFTELERLATEGHRFTAISEERGVVEFGGGPKRVVIDPIDGSLNAKRGLPCFALSVAVADGPRMADVSFGYVFDFGSREEFWASKASGAHLGEKPLAPSTPRDTAADRLEALDVEGTEPARIARFAEELGDTVYRIRSVGSLALALTYVGAGRLDGLVALKGSRPFDVAAAQLIARLCGAKVHLATGDAGQDQGLGIGDRSPCIAARTQAQIDRLEAAVAVVAKKTGGQTNPAPGQ